MSQGSASALHSSNSVDEYMDPERWDPVLQWYLMTNSVARLAEELCGDVVPLPVDEDPEKTRALYVRLQATREAIEKDDREIAELRAELARMKALAADGQTAYTRDLEDEVAALKAEVDALETQSRTEVPPGARAQLAALKQKEYRMRAQLAGERAALAADLERAQRETRERLLKLNETRMPTQPKTALVTAERMRQLAQVLSEDAERVGDGDGVPFSRRAAP